MIENVIAKEVCGFVPSAALKSSKFSGNTALYMIR